MDHDIALVLAKCGSEEKQQLDVADRLSTWQGPLPSHSLPMVFAGGQVSEFATRSCF